MLARLLGQNDKALSHGEGSLKIRRRLSSQYTIGYSYNVLAMIYVDQLRQEEALSYFNKARKAFQYTEDSRGIGLVNIGLGRALRQLGRHKERNAHEEVDPNRTEYQDADQLLTKAIQIFRNLSDEPNLSEALNEKGTLLRQQEKWEAAIECLEESQTLAKKTGNLYRQVDNLVDIAITYDYQGNVDLVLSTAEKASQLALNNTTQLQAFNLFAKAQEVVANSLFSSRDYDGAFEAIANACIHIMRVDPNRQGESVAKRELYYNQMVTWAEEKLLQLPSQELAQEKANYLIERWKKTEFINSYPGFSIRMQDAACDYEFLKM